MYPIQRWADHKDSRTTQCYNRRKELLDHSPGYALGADLAGARRELSVQGRR
ncbi:hypothetical protein ACFV2V_16880 [Streptomyces sp. NPDC059698]|uniref:hypothetical protein n=1 Tax=unclassified Streptomyces TaxID=2593676 RepID=UPI0013017E6C|nr:hypothetical protein [Streptomyces sp. CB02366]